MAMQQSLWWPNRTEFAKLKVSDELVIPACHAPTNTCSTPRFALESPSSNLILFDPSCTSSIGTQIWSSNYFITQPSLEITPTCVAQESSLPPLPLWSWDKTSSSRSFQSRHLTSPQSTTKSLPESIPQRTHKLQ